MQPGWRAKIAKRAGPALTELDQNVMSVAKGEQVLTERDDLRMTKQNHIALQGCILNMKVEGDIESLRAQIKDIKLQCYGQKEKKAISKIQWCRRGIMARRATKSQYGFVPGVVSKHRRQFEKKAHV